MPGSFTWASSNLSIDALEKRWRLKPGLYYFMVETEDGDMLGGGGLW